MTSQARTRTAVRITVAAASAALAAGVLTPPASAGPAGPGGRELAVVGPAAATGTCAGGGRVTLTTRPYGDGVKAVVRARGVDAGSRWTGQVFSYKGDFGIGFLLNEKARGGRWTYTAYLPTPFRSRVTLTAEGGGERRCTVSAKPVSPVSAQTLCGRARTTASITVRPVEGSRRSLVTVPVEGGVGAQSVWDFGLSVQQGDAVALYETKPRRPRPDGTVRVAVPVRLRGDSTIAVTITGRQRTSDGPVVARCQLSLEGRIRLAGPSAG